MKRTVFLDAGGVIVFPNWQRVSDRLAARGVDVAAARLAAADPYARHQLDSPAMIARDPTDQARGWTYFNLVLEHAGVPLSEHTDAALEDLRRYHWQTNLWELIPEDVPAALAALKARFRLVVVSNANGTLHAAFDRLGLSPLVDLVLDSALEGVEKPDPRLFRIALDRSGADPLTTIHVGDLYHIDVVGARAAGLDAILVDSADLYPDADCPRYPSLAAVADALLAELPA
jgi:putative hydrolase of the HAD superfamily